MVPTENGYVVYCHERLRDGRDEWAKCFNTLEHALAYINQCHHGFAGDGMSFRLFKLGDEVAIKAEMTEEPQPAKKTITYTAK